MISVITGESSSAHNLTRSVGMGSSSHDLFAALLISFLASSFDMILNSVKGGGGVSFLSYLS